MGSIVRFSLYLRFVLQAASEERKASKERVQKDRMFQVVHNRWLEGGEILSTRLLCTLVGRGDCPYDEGSQEPHPPRSHCRSLPPVNNSGL